MFCIMKNALLNFIYYFKVQVFINSKKKKNELEIYLLLMIAIIK